MITFLSWIYILSVFLTLYYLIGELKLSGSATVGEVITVVLGSIAPCVNSFLAGSFLLDDFKINFPKFLAYKVWVEKPAKETK